MTSKKYIYVVEFINPATPGFVGHTGGTIVKSGPAYRMVAHHGAFRSPEIASDWARIASGGRDFEIIKLEIVSPEKAK